MSVFQTLAVGVSGLQAQSNSINAIADNLSNVNTVGYKRRSVTFQSVLGNDAATQYTPGGTASRVRSINHAQGLIFSGASKTDLAISGSGFFAAREPGSPTTGDVVYTRAGAFAPDRNGDFRNTAGFFLQGWLLDDEQLPAGLSGSLVSGSVGLASLVPINVRDITLQANPTTEITVKTNLKASQLSVPNAEVDIETNLNAAQLLHPSSDVSVVGRLRASQAAFAGTYNPTVPANNMASGAVTPHFNETVSVIDNTGATRTIQASFLKTSANTWAVELHAVPASAVTQPNGQIAYGTVVFNANGAIASISSGLTSPVTASWNNLGGATSITFDFGSVGSTSGLSQTGSTYDATLTASPDYDPTVSGKSMTSGSVTPDFSQTFTAIDDAGTTRTLAIGFFKLAGDRWAVEVYGVPPSDVTSPSGVVAGQVAYGTVSFNSNGSLATVSSSLTGRLAVGWNNNRAANAVVINWLPTGGLDGITQNSSAYSNTSNVSVYDAADINANMSEGEIQASYVRPFTIVDSEGAERNLTIAYAKLGPLRWAVEIYADTPADIGSTTTRQVSSGTVTFNGDGSLASVTGGIAGTVAISWAGTDPATSSLTFDWGTAGAIGTGDTDGLRQLDAAYTATIRQNGFLAGSLNDVDITEAGYVVGNFNNGVSRKLYKIPLAEFISENQLEHLNGNAFRETLDSGEVYFVQPGDGLGKIMSSALENANVDVAEQMTSMIIAQRAYQANTKIITVADDVLKELKQIGA